MPVLLLTEGVLTTAPFAHQGGDAAAVALHGVEQLVPEWAGAEAGHHGEIQADIDDGAADRTAAHLGLELGEGGGMEIGDIVPGGAARRPGCGLA